MARWTTKTAVVQIDKFIEDLDPIARTQPFSKEHTRWLFAVRSFIDDVFGSESVYAVNFQALKWTHRGGAMIGGPAFPEESFNPQLGIARLNREALQQTAESAKGILLAARDDLEAHGIEDVYQGKDTGPEASLILKVLNLAEHKLRKVLRKIPENERTVQDAFENLLIGADVEYSRETDSIEYSSKTYTPDFTVPKADLAVEIKLCKDDKREKQLPAEMNDDILAYGTKYGNILFVVYDTGFIRDVERFSSNFAERDGVYVIVVKH